MISTSLREHFLADHARLESELLELTNAAEGADAPELVQVFRRLDAHLSAHLAVEEEVLFPVVEDAAALEALRADHAAIRTTLGEIGLSVEIHAIREEAIVAFVERLRAHAAREDALLYRLADQRLDEGARMSVGRRLLTVAQELLAGGEP